MRPIVLTFVRRYLPGYKSGGPVRTIANMVESLNGELDFRIVTLDRDAHDVAPYPGVTVNSWNEVGQAQVYYVEEGAMRMHRIGRWLREIPHDVLYLNSFFDPRFTGLPLLARRLGMVPESSAVLAPRGEFSEGALSLKSWKKLPYMKLTRSAGLYRNLTWQVSSRHEADDVHRAMGPYARDVQIAPNLPAVALKQTLTRPAARKTGAPLRVVFMSRITPKKNLDFALRVLEKVRHPVEFNIAGPIGDEKHWRCCRSLMRKLPTHIRANILGGVEHAAVERLISEHDLFFLPTRGENYGHVIAEALSVGTPVLISDTTPWRGLEQAGVGWDLPLGNERRFAAAIEAASAKEGEEYAAWRQRVVEYAIERLANPTAIEANRKLFLDLCGRSDIRTMQQE